VYQYIQIVLLKTGIIEIIFCCRKGKMSVTIEEISKNYQVLETF